MIFAQVWLWQLTNTVTSRIGGAVHARRGQGLIEYALIIAFIGIGAIIALGVVSGHLGQVFTNISNQLPAATPTPAG